jgi:hypothetical protein
MAAKSTMPYDACVLAVAMALAASVVRRFRLPE